MDHVEILAGSQKGMKPSKIHLLNSVYSEFSSLIENFHLHEQSDFPLNELFKDQQFKIHQLTKFQTV
jgi:hypothetical protein